MTISNSCLQEWQMYFPWNKQEHMIWLQLRREHSSALMGGVTSAVRIFFSIVTFANLSMACQNANRSYPLGKRTLRIVCEANCQRSPPLNTMPEFLIEARDPETSAERLGELWKLGDKDLRRAILDNPNICPIIDGEPRIGLLWRLSREFPEEVSHTATFVFHVILEPHKKMKLVLAEVLSHTKDIGLIHLAWNQWREHWQVRESMAKNPNTPAEILHALGNRENEPIQTVIFYACLNPNTPKEVLRILGNPTKEPDWTIRCVVALNPHTPEDVLQLLCNEVTESEMIVRQAAQKALADRGLV